MADTVINTELRSAISEDVLAQSAGLALLDMLNSANIRARALAAAALADISATNPQTRAWLCKVRAASPPAEHTKECAGLHASV